MELLFWNMGKNDNAALALECMCSNGVSVAAFAEYSGTEFSDELLCGTGYRLVRNSCRHEWVSVRDGNCEC